MGHYYKTIKDNFSSYKNSDKAMWESIELVDDLLEDIKEAHPDKYWEFMRRTHEMMYGMHFDKEYAEWEVEQMHHKSPDGKVCKGEHWSMEETTMVMQKYKMQLSPEITPCDFYVALNATWHDYICWAMEHFESEDEADNAIIGMAVRFWFLDDDWDGNTKVWCYFRMKNK